MIEFDSFENVVPIRLEVACNRRGRFPLNIPNDNGSAVGEYRPASPTWGVETVCSKTLETQPLRPTVLDLVAAVVARVENSPGDR